MCPPLCHCHYELLHYFICTITVGVIMYRIHTLSLGRTCRLEGHFIVKG
jgi:hypothetical protein